MTRKEIARLAVEELEKIYPDIECSLKYTKPYEFMFAARLSAQCTDARVNIVTKTLFVKYPDLQSFADADLEELEQDVKPCGFYHNKAKSLKGMARKLLDDFGGELPDNMDDLLTLPGIGRKTANLFLFLSYFILLIFKKFLFFKYNVIYFIHILDCIFKEIIMFDIKYQKNDNYSNKQEEGKFFTENKCTYKN